MYWGTVFQLHYRVRLKKKINKPKNVSLIREIRVDLTLNRGFYIDIIYKMMVFCFILGCCTLN